MPSNHPDLPRPWAWPLGSQAYEEAEPDNRPPCWPVRRGRHMAGGGELETSLVPCTTFQVRRFRLFPSRALQAAQVLVTPPPAPHR